MEKCDFFSGAFACDHLGFSDLNNFFNFISNTPLSKLPKWEKDIICKDLDIIKESASALYTADEAQKIYLDIYKTCLEVLAPSKSTDILPLFVVDVLPEPFSVRPWKAMCVDQRLGSTHNITHGIYLRDDFLVKGLLEIMLSHEIVHNIISSLIVKKEPYTTLLEEGVCDLLSYYVVLKTMPNLRSAVQTNLIQNRFGAITNTIVRKRYYKMSRLVLHIASKIGVQHLLDALKNGEDILSMPLDGASAPISDATLELLFSMFSLADSSILLPIEEYAIFAFSADKTHSTVAEIATYMSLNDDKVISYLEKMQHEGLLSVDSSKVSNYNKLLFDRVYYFVNQV